MKKIHTSKNKKQENNRKHIKNYSQCSRALHLAPGRQKQFFSTCPCSLHTNNSYIFPFWFFYSEIRTTVFIESPADEFWHRGHLSFIVNEEEEVSQQQQNQRSQPFKRTNHQALFVFDVSILLKQIKRERVRGVCGGGGTKKMVSFRFSKLILFFFSLSMLLTNMDAHTTIQHTWRS